MKKVFLEISQNSKENTCASVFFNKVAGLWPATLLKKRPWHRCFPVNFAKFLKNNFFTEHFWTTASISLENLGNFFKLSFFFLIQASAFENST